MHTTPISLLERLQLPTNQDAWPRFVDLYTPLLYHLARRLGLQQDDAADLVQEVFAVLVHKLPEFRYNREGSFRGWLRTVTLNKWREIQRRRAVGVPGGAELIADKVPVPDETDTFAEEEYRRHLVARALQIMQEQFQPTTWQACWEHVVGGRPALEIAKELGISEGAVYVAKHRVLRRLREELDGLLD